MISEQAIEHFSVAPVAIWAFDYFLTFEHEVRLFTSSGHWGIATVMFIVARYSPIVWIVGKIYGIIEPQSGLACLTMYLTTASSFTLIVVASEGLLLMRTLALWYGNQTIRRCLIASYLVVIITIFSCFGTVLSYIGSICAAISSKEATKANDLSMGLPVSAALFELTAIVATLYHSIGLRFSGIRTVSQLTATLSKGSLLYAMLLFGTSVANIISFSISASDGVQGILAVFQGVLHGVVASRILFELREVNQPKYDNSRVTPETSHIQFASQTAPITVIQEESNV